MADFRREFGSGDWTWRALDIAARAVLDNGEPKLFRINGFLRDECKRLFHEE